MRYKIRRKTIRTTNTKNSKMKTYEENSERTGFSTERWTIVRHDPEVTKRKNTKY